MQLESSRAAKQPRPHHALWAVGGDKRGGGNILAQLEDCGGEDGQRGRVAVTEDWVAIKEGVVATDSGPQDAVVLDKPEGESPSKKGSEKERLVSQEPMVRVHATRLQAQSSAGS